jgi:hypothetical protein
MVNLSALCQWMRRGQKLEGPIAALDRLRNENIATRKDVVPSGLNVYLAQFERGGLIHAGQSVLNLTPEHGFSSFVFAARGYFVLACQPRHDFYLGAEQMRKDLEGKVIKSGHCRFVHSHYLPEGYLPGIDPDIHRFSPEEFGRHDIIYAIPRAGSLTFFSAFSRYARKEAVLIIYPEIFGEMKSQFSGLRLKGDSGYVLEKIAE